MMDIIVISSIKGGVGKSVSTILFSYILSEKYKVLVVDMDSQASTTSYFTRDNKPFNQTIFELLTAERVFDEVVVNVDENIDLIPSHIRLQKFGDIKSIGQELKLKAILEDVKDRYDYIVIDTPPSISPELINALTVANIVVVPLNAEIWSIESLDILKHKLDEVVAVYNRDFKKLSIIQTLYEENRKIPKLFNSELKDAFGESFIHVNIHRSAAVQDMATFRKVPNIRDRYYKEYKEALKEILEIPL